MDEISRSLYELAINPFSSAEPPEAGVAVSPIGSFERCDVCFDPGYDPLDPPPPPDDPDPGIAGI